MIEIVYQVSKDKEADEVSWLHDQKIYPSLSKYPECTYIGVIVNSDAAIAIKLRSSKILMQKPHSRK